ncbi:hypothetical protein FRC04_005662 [Tulasnella sp. 424]|nr:hypothetical protein FRC04_005662 [Tulasnella sp. 424]KAG8962131.1 hypothetical protein FRC05_005505 [Tulasnella sp. 425]
MPIALDAWISSNRIAFLAIVGTFITKEWWTEEVLLDFVEMHGAHDGRYMANCLDKTVAELELLPKMIALAADNASNNGTLVTEFTKLVPNLVKSSETEVRWDGSKAQIRCLLHVVHLAVMALLFGIKVVPVETSDFDFSSEPMSAEDAEILVLENNLEAFLNGRDADVDPLVDPGSAVAKRMETFKKTVMDIENHLVTEAKGHGKDYTPKKPLNLLL